MAYLQFGTATVAAATGVLLGDERFEPSLAAGVVAVLGGLVLLSKTAAEGIPVLQIKSIPAEQPN